MAIRVCSLNPDLHWLYGWARALRRDGVRVARRLVCVRQKLANIATTDRRSQQAVEALEALRQLLQTSVASKSHLHRVPSPMLHLYVLCVAMCCSKSQLHRVPSPMRCQPASTPTTLYTFCCRYYAYVCLVCCSVLQCVGVSILL